MENKTMSVDFIEDHDCGLRKEFCSLTTPSGCNTKRIKHSGSLTITLSNWIIFTFDVLYTS